MHVRAGRNSKHKGVCTAGEPSIKVLKLYSRIHMGVAFTLSFRNAAIPAVVAAGQIKIVQIGTGTRPLLLNSGALSMIMLKRRIMVCQDQTFAPSDIPGSCFCCQNIRLKNMLSSNIEKKLTIE